MIFSLLLFVFVFETLTSDNWKNNIVYSTDFLDDSLKEVIIFYLSTVSILNYNQTEFSFSTYTFTSVLTTMILSRWIEELGHGMDNIQQSYFIIAHNYIILFHFLGEDFLLVLEWHKALVFCSLIQVNSSRLDTKCS